MKFAVAGIPVCVLMDSCSGVFLENETVLDSVGEGTGEHDAAPSTTHYADVRGRLSRMSIAWRVTPTAIRTSSR